MACISPGSFVSGISDNTILARRSRAASTEPVSNRAAMVSQAPSKAVRAFARSSGPERCRSLCGLSSDPPGENGPHGIAQIEGGPRGGLLEALMLGVVAEADSGGAAGDAGWLVVVVGGVRHGEAVG